MTEYLFALFISVAISDGLALRVYCMLYTLVSVGLVFS